MDDLSEEEKTEARKIFGPTYRDYETLSEKTLMLEYRLSKLEKIVEKIASVPFFKGLFNDLKDKDG